MSENNDDKVVDEPITNETAEETQAEVAEPKKPENTVLEDGTIKVDLSGKSEPEADAEATVNEEQEVETAEVEAEAQEEDIPTLELVEDSDEDPEEDTPVAEEPTKEVEKEEQQVLPENIQKLVDFMEETGGNIEDYVYLNKDLSSLDDKAMLREYYQKTKSHLNKEEIDFLIEDKFSFDEEIDDERDIKRKKLAFKEEANHAREYLGGMREKYYADIKAGSKLTPEQKHAVDFFNRHNIEAEETSKAMKQQSDAFLNRTDKLFNEKFKGFEYEVGEKKYRFNVKNSGEVKAAQSDINNFVKKFLGDDGMMSDAKGYHKSLFTAMNPDVVANHFYEQGRADAINDSIERSKNVDMDPRGTHEKVTQVGGFKVRAVSGDDSSKLRVRIKQ
tara:strand:- start:6 stop:1172 length:1167 start_codon:yes stop_codon:yes gene_type:complete